MTPKLIAGALGTFWLVLGGCGSTVLATQLNRQRFPQYILRNWLSFEESGTRSRVWLPRN